MSDLVDIGAIDEFAPDEPVLKRVGDVNVCVARVGDKMFAIHDTCSHAMESLSAGWIEEGAVACPRHGAAFSLRTGEPQTPPATDGVPTFPVEIVDGRVMVDPTPSRPHNLLG